MLRISITSNSHAATLRLEGTLLEPWLADLDDAVRRARALGSVIQLDLADLRFVDAAGERAIESLLRNGATLVACSSFVAELLQVGQS